MQIAIANILSLIILVDLFINTPFYNKTISILYTSLSIIFESYIILVTLLYSVKRFNSFNLFFNILLIIPLALFIVY